MPSATPIPPTRTRTSPPPSTSKARPSSFPNQPLTRLRSLEQSSLISRLAAEDRSQTNLFRNLFSAVLLLTTVLLLAFSRSRRSASSTLLVLASVLSSGLALVLEAPGSDSLPSRWEEHDRTTGDGMGGGADRRRRAASENGLGWWQSSGMPLLRKRVLPLSSALAALLGLRIGVRSWMGDGLLGKGSEGFVEVLAVGKFQYSFGLGLELIMLPPGIFFFVLLLRYLLRPVDLSSLADLKYNYKGA